MWCAALTSTTEKHFAALQCGAKEAVAVDQIFFPQWLVLVALVVILLKN